MESIDLRQLPLEQSELSPEETLHWYRFAKHQRESIRTGLRERSNPGEWLGLYTLHFLGSNGEEELSWAYALLRAREQVALRISEDLDLPAAIRSRFAPRLANSGNNLTYFLVAPSVEGLLSQQDLATLPLTTTGVYKPRHQTLGGLDSPLIYVHQGFDLLRGIRTETGYTIRTLADDQWVTSLPAEPPETLEWEGKFYNRRHTSRTLMNPGEECFSEYLFSLIAQFHSLPNIPDVTIERLEHADFGPHHTVGSRQTYIPNTTQIGEDDLGLLEAFPDSAWMPMIFLDLLTGNVGRHINNILLRDPELFPIDAGCALHSFVSAANVLNNKTQLAWKGTDAAQLVFPRKWKLRIQELDPETLISHLQQKVALLDQRFPEDAFAVTLSQELLLNVTHAFLKEGVNCELTPKDLSRFYIGKRVKEGNRYLEDAQGNEFYVGGEFWGLLGLCLTHPAEYPRDSLDEKMNLFLSKTKIFRSLNSTLLEVRRTLTPEEFVHRTLEGEFDWKLK